MKELTERQENVFEFICQHSERKGYPPTIREIGEKFGLNSTGSVRDYLKALEKKGYISRNSRTSRGIELLKNQSTNGVIRKIPLIGSIAAGTPMFAQENFEDEIVVDANRYDRLSDYFALRVKGQSMVNAGILDGDTVFVKKQDHAQNGEIVAALLVDGEDAEATVKYFYQEEDRIRLQPANDHFEPIIISPGEKNIQIAGKVVSVMREY